MASAKDYMVDVADIPKYGPPNMAAQLYSMIRGVPQAFEEGRENQFKQGQRERQELIQKPYVDADGKPLTDFNAIQAEMAKRGLPPDLGLAWKQKFLENDTPTPSPYGGGSDPSTRADAQTSGPLRAAASAQAERGGTGGTPNVLPSGADKGEGPGGDTVRTAATSFFGGDNDVSALIPRFARALGVDPDGDLSPGQLAQLKGFMGRTKEALAAGGQIGGPQGNYTASLGSPAPPGGGGMPGGASAAPVGPPGAPPVQMAQAGSAAPGQRAPIEQAGALAMVPKGADARAFAQRMQEAARELREKARREGIAGIPSKAREDQAATYDKNAEAILKELAEGARPTNPSKEARDPAIIAAAAQKKTVEALAEAKVKNVATRIEAIKPARDTVQVLDEMDSALTHGWDHISTGPGARQMLEVKKAINNFLPGTFQNVTEAETVDKLNAQLAAAAAKAMTARPSQLEFKAFMANNPGLLTSREGSKVLIDLLRQQKQQEVRLGIMADKFDPNGGKSWSETEEKFYNDNPIISPSTHKPIDAKQAKDGKWYRPDPNRPGKYLEER